MEKHAYELIILFQEIKKGTCVRNNTWGEVKKGMQTKGLILGLTGLSITQMLRPCMFSTPSNIPAFSSGYIILGELYLFEKYIL